jgi:hypothetical protein
VIKQDCREILANTAAQLIASLLMNWERNPMTRCFDGGKSGINRVTDDADVSKDRWGSAAVGLSKVSTTPSQEVL